MISLYVNHRSRNQYCKLSIRRSLGNGSTPRRCNNDKTIVTPANLRYRKVLPLAILLMTALIDCALASSPAVKQNGQMHQKQLETAPMEVSLSSSPDLHHKQQENSSRYSETSVRIVWEEEREDETLANTEQQGEKPIPSKPPRRLLWWKGCMEDPDMPWMPSAKTTTNSKDLMDEEEINPHPLRTDVWNVTLRWRGRNSPTRKKWKRVQWQLEFADNGFVRIVDENANATNTLFRVGTWELAAAGLTWTLPESDQEDLIFYADLHLNPFGDFPKFTRGIVLSQQDVAGKQKQWFRPVVATFRGMGVGKDTSDLAYRHRKGFGL